MTTPLPTPAELRELARKIDIPGTECNFADAATSLRTFANLIEQSVERASHAKDCGPRYEPIFDVGALGLQPLASQMPINTELPLSDLQLSYMAEKRMESQMRPQSAAIQALREFRKERAMTKELEGWQKAIEDMTPNPVPSIPSREAVEIHIRDHTVYLETQVMLRDLLAEVERMRKNWASSHWTYDEANSFLRSNDELRATVSAQAAELAKLRNALEICSANTGSFNPARKAIDAALAQSASQMDAPRATQGKDGGQSQ